MIRLVKQTVITIIFITVLASLAQAQATRTWVSGVGDDANPCSRTAPCKTFAGAISKTAAGGEISVLDPGGFGVVTITKSITIDGNGVVASILTSGTNGVNVAAGATDVVILRNLSIVGVNAPGSLGLNGINYTGGATLVVEDCKINGFSQSAINVSLTGDGNLIVRNTTLTNAATGIKMNSTTGKLTGVADHVAIRNATIGVDTLYGNFHVTNSTISGSTNFGVYAEAGLINIENSLVTHNGVAVQAQVGALIRMSNNSFYDNLTGFGCGGGTLASAGNNRKAGNTGGNVPVCSPNLSVTIQ